jgi:malonate transporter
MLSILVIVLPIFALILAGWGARRSGVLGPNATGELNRFVVHLALPALLFDIVAGAHWQALWQPGFIGAVGLAAGIVFAGTVLVRVRRHGLADAAVDGLNAAYANNGFIGFPLAAAVFGRVALAPTLIAVILTVCILFAIALILIEVGVQAGAPGGAGRGRMIARVATSVGRNPLVIAPAAGALVLASGVAMPVPVETFLKLLGGAASPCALVALGLFLAEKRATAPPPVRAVAGLVALKLIAVPALTWLLATRVFALSAPMTHIAVLLAALPTGTGPFMVAEYYRREAGLTARVVLVSTVLSLATITAYLAMVR